MKSLQLTKPHIIVVVGIPGSGKTFFAEQFSKTFSAPFLNYADVMSLIGDDRVTDSVWDYLLDQILQTKQTIIIETSTASRNERRTLGAFARSKGYQTLFVWVQTEPVTAEARAVKGTPGQNKRQLISSNDFTAKATKFEPLNGTENYMVISGKHTYASQAKNVLKKLVEPRAESAKLPLVAERPDDFPTDVPSPRPGRITIN